MEKFLQPEPTATEFVEAMAVKNGVIVAIGNQRDILKRYQAPDSAIIELNNKLVVS